MALKPNMNTYDWNRYYAMLAVGIFGAIVVKGISILPSWGILVAEVLFAASTVTLAFMQEPKRPKTNEEIEKETTAAYDAAMRRATLVDNGMRDLRGVDRANDPAK